MKIHFVLSALLIGFMLASCQKEETDKDHFVKFLPGNYDWVSSNSNTTDGETQSPLFVYKPSTQGVNYGLRIKKNGDAFLYENGKQTKKGEVKKITQAYYGSYPYYSYNTYFIVTLDFDGTIIDFSSLHSGEYNGLSNSSWPYPNFNNNFKAIPK